MKEVNNDFAVRVLKWYNLYGRKDLPWQKPPTPYRVWLSEIMLQQTQVKTVIGYFERFLTAFPDIATLAAAPLDDVLTLWSGLGYYARARNLHRAANVIVDLHQGEMPSDLTSLTELPGIGRSTAGAIRSLAFNKAAPILDGNVKRVLCRYHAVMGWPGKTQIANQLWEIATALSTTHDRPSAFTQAMMDLGATCCTRAQPQCHHCPLHHDCKAYQTETVDQYPTPKPRKTLPIRQATLVCLVKDEQFLVFKRPEQGIWGGLWSFLSHANETTTVDYLHDEWQISATPCFTRETARHTFTHFHLDYTIDVVTLQSDLGLLADKPYAWYNAHALPAIGLPQPVKKAWKELAKKLKEGAL